MGWDFADSLHHWKATERWVGLQALQVLQVQRRQVRQQVRLLAEVLSLRSAHWVMAPGRQLQEAAARALGEFWLPV